MPETASFQGYFAEVSFDTTEGNQLSYLQTGYFDERCVTILIMKNTNQITHRISSNFSSINYNNNEYNEKYKSNETCELPGIFRK